MSVIQVKLPSLAEKLKRLTPKELKLYESGYSLSEIFYLKFLKELASKPMEIKLIKIG